MSTEKILCRTHFKPPAAKGERAGRGTSVLTLTLLKQTKRKEGVPVGGNCARAKTVKFKRAAWTRMRDSREKTGTRGFFRESKNEKDVGQLNKGAEGNERRRLVCILRYLFRSGREAAPKATERHLTKTRKTWGKLGRIIP